MHDTTCALPYYSFRCLVIPPNIAGMLSQSQKPRRKRLRKTQSASVIPRRDQVSSQTSSDACVGLDGARTAATLAFVHAYPQVSTQAGHPPEVDKVNARRHSKSEGSHFARNRSNAGQSAHHGSVCRKERKTQTRPRFSRSLQTLTQRASMRHLGLCGVDDTRKRQGSPGSDTQIDIAESNGKDHENGSCRSTQSFRYISNTDHASADPPIAFIQASPTIGKSTQSYRRNIEQGERLKCLANARDQELRKHQHESRRHLRSFVSMSFRSRPVQLEFPRTETSSQSELCQSTDLESSRNHHKHSHQSRFADSLRHVPRSFRRFCKDTFTFESKPVTSQYTGKPSQLKNDCDGAIDAQERVQSQHQHGSGNGGTFFACSPKVSSPTPPTPPPHLDFSSLALPRGQNVIQKTPSGLCGSINDRSNVTSWSDSDSDKTVLMQKFTRHPDPFTQTGSCAEVQQVLADTNERSRVIHQRKGSKIARRLPSLDAQRKISLFLKHIGHSSNAKGLLAAGSSDTSNRESSPSSDSMEVRPEHCPSSLANDRTIRLLSHVDQCDRTVSGHDQRTEPQEHLPMSPSIYSHDSVNSPRRDETNQLPSIECEHPLAGTATVGGSKSITRWSLEKKRGVSGGTLPNTSNEWRTWTSEKLANFGLNTHSDHVKPGDRNSQDVHPIDVSQASHLGLGSSVSKCKIPGTPEGSPSLYASRMLDDKNASFQGPMPTVDPKLKTNDSEPTTKYLARRMMSSVGGNVALPLEVRRSNAVKPNDRASSLKFRQCSRYTARESGIAKQPLLHTPEAARWSADRSCLSTSPMSDNFIRRIQRGPYASPSPVSQRGSSPPSSSKLSGRPERAQNRENMPPYLSRGMLDNFITSRSNLSEGVSDQYSPAFL